MDGELINRSAPKIDRAKWSMSPINRFFSLPIQLPPALLNRAHLWRIPQQVTQVDHRARGEFSDLFEAKYGALFRTTVSSSSNASWSDRRK